MHFLHRSNIT